MSVDFGKVGVLYGGKSKEREISLLTGAGVAQALRQKGIDAHLFDTGLESVAALIQQKFDRVFIALHGILGEDGAIQGLLELLEIPYTGSGVCASAVAMDKVLTKNIWQKTNIPTPAYAEVTSALELESLCDRLGFPLIVKPVAEGSTIGLTKVTDKTMCAEAYALASVNNPRVLVEQFIQGRELTVAVLGNTEVAQALPIIEIVAPGGNYDLHNKYYSDETRYICPADLPEAVTQQIQELCVDAFHSIGCEGWGRIDIMLDEHNIPMLLEINTSPGMTSHSLVPMAARAVGLSYEDLCVKILQTARCKIQR